MPLRRIGDVNLYYEIDGPGPATVALVNGVAMTVKSWQPIRERLVAGGFRCLLHDCRGQLRSDKPVGNHYSLELHAADFLNLLNALDLERVHLVGTSYGAEIAMVFASAYPQRVEALTLIAAASDLDGLMRAAAESWAIAADCGGAAFVRCMAPWAYSSDYLTRNRTLLREHEEAISRLPSDFFAAFKGLVRAFLQLDITDRLKRIRCPTLVISAELDLIKGPRFGQLICNEIADAELLVIPGAGHAVVLEQPDLIAERTIRFINQHRARRDSVPPPQ